MFVVETDHIALFFFTVVKQQEIETYSLLHQREGEVLVHRERFPRMLQNLKRTQNPFAGLTRVVRQYFRLTCDAPRHARLIKDGYQAVLHLLSISWSRYWLFIKHEIRWILIIWLMER